MAYVRTRAEAGYLCAMKGVALPSVVPRFEDGSELRSLRSSPEEKVQLAFINTTPHTVECWWINNWGQPIYYGTMEPAGSEASVRCGGGGSCSGSGVGARAAPAGCPLRKHANYGVNAAHAHAGQRVPAGEHV